jgi:hypothetical protein
VGHGSILSFSSGLANGQIVYNVAGEWVLQNCFPLRPVSDLGAIPHAGSNIEKR